MTRRSGLRAANFGWRQEALRVVDQSLERAQLVIERAAERGTVSEHAVKCPSQQVASTLARVHVGRHPAADFANGANSSR